jgi:TetR/AcrR family fatty acid metabolism transcriptional regulator
MAKRTNTKRQEQAQETKNRIYTSAIELMDRKGFENITIADISDKAGVSVGAFYHYFTSKNDILAEIFHQADTYFATQVLPELDRTKSVPEQILQYFDHYARFNITSGVELTQQIFNPKIKFFLKKDRPMVTILEDLIREGQERSEIREDLDSEELARFLFVMARGVVFEWSLYDGSYDLEATMHAYIERLISTITSG